MQVMGQGLQPQHALEASRTIAKSHAARVAVLLLPCSCCRAPVALLILPCSFCLAHVEVLNLNH